MARSSRSRSRARGSTRTRAAGTASSSSRWKGRLANGSTEPSWLSERRRKGASLASELELPNEKDKGWEFTDLAGLEIDSFEPTRAAVAGINGDSDPGLP